MTGRSLPPWLADELERRDLDAARTWLTGHDFGPHHAAVIALIRGCGDMGIQAAVEALHPLGWHGFRAEQSDTRSTGSFPSE